MYGFEIPIYEKVKKQKRRREVINLHTREFIWDSADTLVVENRSTNQNSSNKN